MMRRFRTIRARLALINLLVVSVTLIVLSSVLMRMRQAELLRDFDNRLTDQARTIIESLDDRAVGSAQSIGDQRLIPFRFPGYYIQIRRQDGTVVEQSQNLAGAQLPLARACKAQATNSRPYLQTVDIALTGHAKSLPVRLRLLTLRGEDSARTPFFLQLARDLLPVNEAVADLQRVILIVVPLAILVAGCLSYSFAHRALVPLREISSEARALSATDLNKRLPVPRQDDEMAELAGTLNAMLDRLARAFRAQDQFIANASHELKTPLSIVLGMVSVLKQKARTPEEYDRFASSVEDEIRGLANLVSGLLLLARADAGAPLGGARPTALNDIVTDAVQRCQTVADQREVRLVVNLPLPAEDESEPVVYGDATLLVTMVANVIRNAVRYSPVDKPVNVSAAVRGGCGHIIVRDSGSGIEPDRLSRIFERFYRADSQPDQYEGVGLGLAIARAVAHVHGGEIQAHNHPAGGCEFAISLPLRAAPGD